MNNVHVKAVRDLRNNYPEISQILKNSDRVIITNNGKSEAVIIPFDEFERYEEYTHIRYVKQKLAEAESIANDPENWAKIDELFSAWDAWDAVEL